MIKIKKKILFQSEFNIPGKPAVVCTPAQLKLISEFNRKVRNGEITFESVVCLCGCHSFDLISRVDRYGMLQDTVLCCECGMVLSNPRMTGAEYANFYSSDLYRTCYDGENYLSDYESRYTLKHGGHILEAVSRVLPVNSATSVLEIGAGGGWNLLPFMEQGASVLGIDYSPSLVALGKQHKIPMQQGTLDSVTGKYDVIVLNHVLEHFLDPLGALKKIHGFCKPAGIVYISVPNILNFTIGQLQNAHTYYFTPYTLVRYCAQAGLGLCLSGEAQKIHFFAVFKPGKPVSRLDRRFRGNKINFALVKAKTVIRRFWKRS
ncbi:MAG: class I SAM-dependent methyltransferase [Candidatus Omnitrophota bacterium]